jgi:hypothetical protein
MMDTIAQRQLESVGWGLKMRLYTGAGLSTMDLISDLYMIYYYATTGERGAALSLGIMVGLCLSIQLFVAWFQCHKGPSRVMLKEMIIVLGGLKPGWDAMKVATGAEQGEHATLTSEVELTFTRGIEMAMEAAPGSVLQTYSLLQGMKGGGGYSRVALGSIIVSALTTGFCAATISFE